MRAKKAAILLFGLVNACVFAGLLPLWEGFDEAFHYGYVETLWQTRRPVVLGRTLIPKDVAGSFAFAPVSHVLSDWIAGTTSFDTWVSLTPEEKQRRRGELEGIRPEAGSGERPNYEAHQPPLAYLLLAVLDGAMAGAPITVRVLVLRCFGAVSATLLLYFGATSLLRTVGLPERFARAALFAIFCSEMLWATVAHVANDWLAVGISAMLFAAAARLARDQDRHALWKVAGWLGAGLLTKAYFLVFAIAAAAWGVAAVVRRRMEIGPVLAAAGVVVALAGPWYLRNVVLYGDVSGTHEEFNGIGMKQALAAVPRIHWFEATGAMARGSAWTGNNSFTSFARGTINGVLALLAVAMAAWAWRRRAIESAEWMLVGAIAMFSVGVAYATAASFADRGGSVAGASPWYAQVLLLPVVTLAFLGLSRWSGVGASLAGFTVASWAWVLVATWTVKLFPLYSGGGATPMRVREVWNWYAHGAAEHARELSLLALLPAAVLYAGMVVSVGLALGLAGTAVWDLWRDDGGVRIRDGRVADSDSLREARE